MVEQLWELLELWEPLGLWEFLGFQGSSGSRPWKKQGETAYFPTGPSQASWPWPWLVRGSPAQGLDLNLQTGSKRRLLRGVRRSHEVFQTAADERC